MDGITKIKKIVAVSLAAVCLGVTGIMAIATDGFKPKNPSAVEPSLQVTGADSDVALNVEETHGISLTSKKLTSTTYTSSGVSVDPESGYSTYILSATVTPANTTYKAFSWSVDWNASSAGQSDFLESDPKVTDYVTLTPSEDTLSAKLVCGIKAFGASMVVKVTWNYDPNVYAMCKVDYEQRVTDVSSTIESNSIVLNDKTLVSFKYTYGIGSTHGNLIVIYPESVNITLDEDFCTVLRYNEYFLKALDLLNEDGSLSIKSSIALPLKSDGSGSFYFQLNVTDLYEYTGTGSSDKTQADEYIKMALDSIETSNSAAFGTVSFDITSSLNGFDVIHSTSCSITSLNLDSVIVNATSVSLDDDSIVF